MATYSAAVAVHATLTTTTADTVTITGSFDLVDVIPRGSNALFVTYGNSAAGVATPTAGADNTLVATAAHPLTLDADGGGLVVKVVGDGDAYSVQGVTARRY